ncbi:nucleoside deaminase [Holospora curviuscula]|uniref:tRNA-specific adenosine deaminase n=1 Tax=Holospora curviuscula TaxID=1082868 RepID=A0A2S5R7T1_9PROT|nr:nucleoside deaminase [Holospora curviuscula]PPE03242.1 tRNA-specific adenosine deaminase [Holospora curviuscula]
MFSEAHKFMDRALVLAEKAKTMGEVPVGAVLVYEDRILFENHNRMRQYALPWAHAELLVLKAAHRLLKTYYLLECSLYVTLEPCSMCASALALSRLKTVCFGAYDPKHGGIEHGARVFDEKSHFYKPKILLAGVRAHACEKLLKTFFSCKRE